MARGYRTSDSRRYFDWLYYATIDLRAAKLLMEDPACYNGVAFHCQQCIEKGLKGYLLWKRHRLYDGHNLPWLCKQAIQEDESFRKWMQASVTINRYYIEARYPADFLLQLDENTVSSVILDTTDVLELIHTLVKFDFASYRHKKPR